MRDALSESTGAPKGTGPKSKSGVRAIPLIPYMRGILEKRKPVQRAKLAATGVELHELRHTCLTLLGATGSSASVLKSLGGWASIAEADSYVHADDTANREAVERLSAALEKEIARADDVTPDVPAQKTRSEPSSDLELSEWCP